MPEKVKVTSTEILSDNFFPLKKVKYELETKKGKVEELTREVYFSPNGVAIYCITGKTTVSFLQVSSGCPVT